MATRYLDFDGGNDANDGTTFANRKKTLGSACSGLSAGDTVRVMASPDPTSLGQDATLTNGSDTVTLTTAVTANIDTCESAWTASANVTATAQSTTQREGTNAASLVIASGFTTGLVAYRATGTLDLSAYKQISFLIRANNTIAASTLTLTLCSDAAGVTAVHTVSIPALPANHWMAVVLDTGSALSSSIQSVALNALLDPGSRTVYLDNIIACKDSTAADSLTHYSLIGKNTGNEPWMAIDSINGTTIKLGGGYQDTASRSGFQPYYYGTTATQTLYKREPIIITATQTPSNGSTQGDPLNIECGWDRTAMSSQSGLTFCRRNDPSLSVISASTTSYNYLNKFYAVGGVAGVVVNQGWTFGEFGAIACYAGLYLYQTINAHAFTSALRYFMHCTNAIDTTGSGVGSPNETRLRIAHMWGVKSSSFQHGAINDDGSALNGRLLLVDCDIQGHYAAVSNTTPGAFIEVTLQNCTLKNLDRRFSTEAAKVFVINCTITSVAETVTSTGTIYYINQGGDTTNHAIVFGSHVTSGSIASDTSVRHTASDFSWKFTRSAVGSTYNPVFLSIAKVACVANEQRTVTAWLRRSSTSLVTRLRVKGGLVSGIADDITANMTAAINTWEQVTIQFTPTQQCVVEVFAECYGASAANAWVDDIGVS